MKSKLTELIKEAMQYADNRKDIGELHKPYEEYIAEYLIDNNTIVTPCKVGDVVYCEYNKKVIEGTVRLIRPFISANGVVFKGNLICEVDNPFLDNGTKEVIELYVVFDTSYEIRNGIDRIAYCTKEEAEKALKGEGK